MKITHAQFARLTLEEAIRGTTAAELSAIDLVEASAARMNVFESTINAVITRTDEVSRRNAEASGDLETSGRRILRGIPVAVKDNMMTRGIRTTCGSRILENFIPPYDATAVARLKSAGAVVMGKTNLDEFAMGSTGEHSAYGPTANPWDPGRIPGGSSSGSAALVAYGGALAALGSDTGGSIRQPAAFCGVVGMKPTYGRVSRYGLGALASSLDQIGPLTRTVRDNALILDVISGRDPLDSTSAPGADSAPPCLPGIEEGVNGLKMAFDPGLLRGNGISPAIADAVRRAVALAREGGAIVNEAAVPLIKYGVAAYYIICSCEASANLARFDGVRYGFRREGGDIWDVFSETRGRGFGDEVKRRIMMGSYALSQGYYDAYYLKAARVRRKLSEEFSRLFKTVDIFLLPVAPQFPRPLGAKAGVMEDYLGDIFTLAANLAGLPAISFPVGVFADLPAGVQAVAGPFNEHLLYRLARAVEKNTSLENAPWTLAGPKEAK
ncbi:MAG: Asp-tRNA(Asn)/Glu-tRNA(Gln) amidotransferase subunit GatA [Planctomycetota bacterium]|jgi:aspartyl-tRNA(Asn)/glutamyl-tRNA(Gln) amidotransferase subunit A|nr:Asp-tRNA(Asn)/Glu-tRNA(Gln) amidotransferase subunit GatA [Planctomycetota bacterium]